MFLSALLTVSPAHDRALGETGQAATAVPTGFQSGEQDTVSRIEALDRLTLSSGLVVRLSAISAVRERDVRDAVDPLFFSEALEDVRRAVGDGPVRLHYDGRRRDRYGRAIAQVETADGRWLQALLVSRGWARVSSYPDNRRGVPDLLGLERAARLRGKGLWALPAFRIRNPDETWDDIDSFQIAEGRVVAVATVRGRTYLNFGRDWRRDFTVSATGSVRRLFAKAGVDLESLNRRRVRTRGWITLRNGPMIELTHPEQLEVLDE